MPLKSPKRQISDTENKLRLLCCIDALGAVTEAQLWPFVASLEFMEYIPMQLLLHDLIKSGDVETGERALYQHIFLSEQGRQTLRLFAHRVMPSDKQQIRRAAPAYRAEMLQHRQIRAVYEMAQAGDYRVLLALYDGELPTLAIRLATSHRDFAAQAIHSFEAQASAILTHLYSMDTSAPASGQNPPVSTENMPTVTRHSRCEYIVTAVLTHPEVTMTLSLLLPDLHQATAYQLLFSRPDIARTCAQKLVSLLGNVTQEGCEEA